MSPAPAPTRREAARADRCLSIACHCVLNDLHLKLEGKAVPGRPGPMTFGEVACQPLSQTPVCLTVEPALG